MTEPASPGDAVGPRGGDRPAVAVVGSVNLDTTVRVPHIPTAGETILASDTASSPGGKGANQAAAAAAAGAAVRFIGAIGADAVGEAAVAGLRAFDVDLSELQTVAHAPSGAATVVVADDAENLIIVTSGANDHLDPDLVAAALDRRAGPVLLTQLETPLAVLAECGRARAFAWRILNPAPISADPGLRPLLAGFTLLVPNRTELAQLAGLPVPRTIAEVSACVAALGFDGDVVVTLGADGAALYPAGGGAAPEAPRTFAPPPVRAIDTTGAGDVFCGTLASGLAAHGDLERAVADAVEASARSTELPRAQLVPGDAAVAR
ncbi:PfkB family carbohydrate kinase [Leucobacter allii]|uniref:Ribokinase n=1 Tax=Leucobacter allii TaxID=2932247 RepID=A0ABY4FJG7_9MICO|nr:PfkB family carbohydrate kinase [Leucobacter allii]UOQ56112.1 PfkB family carbohydrate kinase [Leucobacter allii]